MVGPRRYRGLGWASAALCAALVGTGIVAALRLDARLPGLTILPEHVIVDLLERGLYQRALVELDRTLELDPERPDFQAQRAQALHKLGRTEEGVEQLRRTLEARPDFVEGRLILVTQLKSLGRSAEAVEELETLVRQLPTDAELRTHLGVALQESGDEERALAHFQAALLRDPGFLPASYHLAQLRLERGEAELARGPLERAVAARQDSADLIVLLAQVHEETGRPESAAALYAQVLRLDPGRAPIWRRMIDALAASDQHAEAGEVLAQLDPASTTGGDPVLLNNVAWVLATHPVAERRRPELAVQLAERAVEIDRDAAALDTLAAAYARAGRLPEAVEAARLALQPSEATGDPREAAAIRGHLEAFSAGRTIEAAPAPLDGAG